MRPSSIVIRGWPQFARLTVVAALPALAIVACEVDGGPGKPSEWRIASDASATTPCGRPDGPTEAGERRVVLEETPAPCDIVAVPVTALRPSLEGTHPDPGSRAVKTSDGRYYTRSATSGEVLAWDGDGNLVEAVGRWGEGPGEFVQRGAVFVFLDAHDTLFVLDGAQRWGVFDSSLAFQRTFLGLASGRDPKAMHVTQHGILTTGNVMEGRTPRAFHLMDRDGALVRSFGPEADQGGGSMGPRLTRISAYDPEREVLWVAPPNGEPAAPLLEEWTLDGTLLRSLERPAPWFPGEPYPPAPYPGEPELPEYETVHLDPDGLLWVTYLVRSENWRPIEDREARMEVVAELYEARLDVIDPDAERILASVRVDMLAEEPPPFGRFFPDTREAYRMVEDSVGLRTVEIFELRLVEK